jgi:D-hydroxyproline dehydrogenase subunit alpha
MLEERVDIVVIGGGPAGITAAACAAEHGKSAVVIDEGLGLGGQIWRHRESSALPRTARESLMRFTRSGAVARHGTTVVDVRHRGSRFIISAECGGAGVVLDAGALVIATGARERFLPFPGWTLPGVIGVGGAQALLKSGASFAGKRVVIAGSGPLLLPVAASLRAHGATVLLVAEQARMSSVARFTAGLVRRPSLLLQAARYRAGFAGTAYSFGQWPIAAHGARQVESVLMSDGRRIPCDVLCAAFGLVPNTELARLLGCAVVDGAVQVDVHQCTSVPGVYCAGEPTGIGGVDLALAEGEIAGRHASGAGAAPPALAKRRDRLRALALATEATFAPREELKRLATPDTIVCRCEDVRAGAIDPSWTPRQAKLYTRAGMGPCQGRVCGAAFTFLHGWPSDSVRLPVAPASYLTLSAGSTTTAANVDQGA